MEEFERFNDLDLTGQITYSKPSPTASSMALIPEEKSHTIAAPIKATDDGIRKAVIKYRKEMDMSPI